MASLPAGFDAQEIVSQLTKALGLTVIKCNAPSGSNWATYIMHEIRGVGGDGIEYIVNVSYVNGFFSDTYSAVHAGKSFRKYGGHCSKATFTELFELLCSDLVDAKREYEQFQAGGPVQQNPLCGKIGSKLTLLHNQFRFCICSLASFWNHHS
jgi:hypothetical protein